MKDQQDENPGPARSWKTEKICKRINLQLSMMRRESDIEKTIGNSISLLFLSFRATKQEEKKLQLNTLFMCVCFTNKENCRMKPKRPLRYQKAQYEIQFDLSGIRKTEMKTRTTCFVHSFRLLFSFSFSSQIPL